MEAHKWVSGGPMASWSGVAVNEGYSSFTVGDYCVHERHSHCASADDKVIGGDFFVHVRRVSQARRDLQGEGDTVALGSIVDWEGRGNGPCQTQKIEMLL